MHTLNIGLICHYEVCEKLISFIACKTQFWAKITSNAEEYNLQHYGAEQEASLI